MSDTIKINDPEVAVLSETKAGVFVPVFDLTETEPADQFKSIELSTIVEDAVTQALDQNNDAQPLIYKALITQSGADAPTAIVLENTLGGEVVWTRADEGVYIGDLAGAFPINKTLYFINAGTYYRPEEGAVNYELTRMQDSEREMRIITYLEGSSADGLLNEHPILIEVYP
jgi:hypothetical protein